MKIAVLNEYFLPNIGGAQICAHSLADGLKRLGHDVVLYADQKDVDACEKRGWKFNYELKGISSLPTRMVGRVPALGTWIAATYLASILKRDQVDVLQIVCAWPWLASVSKLKKLIDIPIVLRCAGDDIQIDNKVGYGVTTDKLWSRLFDEGFRHVDHCIAISNTVVKEYQKKEIPTQAISDIPPGVDNQAFQQEGFDRKKVREKWNLPQDKELLIAVGRNHHKKGFTDLIDALPLLNEKRKRFHAVFVGKGTTELNTYAKSKGLEGQVHTIEEVASYDEKSSTTFPSKDLVDLYRASDMFTFPTYIETYANVALEAMAAGIPVVITKTPGCVDTVVEGVDGLFVEADQPEEMAKRILEIADNPELKAKLLEGGSHKASHQDWLDVSRQYYDIYERLLQTSVAQAPLTAE